MSGSLYNKGKPGIAITLVHRLLSLCKSCMFSPFLTNVLHFLIDSGRLLSNLLASANKSVTVEKKCGHPIYVVGYDKNSQTERLSFISSAIMIISFVTFLGLFLPAKPLEEDLKKEDLETTIKASVTSLQTEMATIHSNLEAIKKDIGELKEKKFSFKFW